MITIKVIRVPHRPDIKIYLEEKTVILFRFFKILCCQAR